MIRILIADDHSLIREGFKKFIDREVDMAVVGEAQNAAQVYEFLENNECDVIVLDINMPGKSGMDLLAELKELNLNIKILILSMHPEDRFAVRALKLGASGYLTKESAPEELIKAIQKIHSGGKYVSQNLAEKLASDLDEAGDQAPHEKLSDREYQVLCLLGAGKTAQEISEKLCISLSTVNTYRSRVLEKMNLSSNAEIIRYAIKNNLVD